jgi:hypothetical protein
MSGGVRPRMHLLNMGFRVLLIVNLHCGIGRLGHIGLDQLGAVGNVMGIGDRFGIRDILGVSLFLRRCLFLPGRGIRGRFGSLVVERVSGLVA